MIKLGQTLPCLALLPHALTNVHPASSAYVNPAVMKMAPSNSLLREAYMILDMAKILDIMLIATSRTQNLRRAKDKNIRVMKSAMVAIQIRLLLAYYAEK